MGGRDTRTIIRSALLTRSQSASGDLSRAGYDEDTRAVAYVTGPPAHPAVRSGSDISI